ncbi:MAG TPA: peptidylprolyl isomerase [Chitinophagaceae bacterium]|nr:peptidylprolyl isomerase [Chitinophagaceae bacterium]
MSIIQKIRDKYARVAVIAIAVALLGFILTDYITGRGRNLFSGNSTNTVGRVNRKKIEINDFEKKVKQYEDYMTQNGFSPGGSAAREQAIEAVWDQEVSRIVLNDEIAKLGIDVGKKEINDMLFGANPPEDLKKQFTDPATGQYNAAEAMRQINEMKRKGTADAKENFNTYLGQLENSRMMEKYNSMLSNSINFPKWLIEKQNAENSLLGKITLVREVYSSIPDSSVKVSDDEIADYVSKHKNDYKQVESRSISYVAFSAAPSTKDSLYTKEKSLSLKAQLDTTKDVDQLLASEGLTPGYNGFISGKKIQVPFKDSIFKTPVGQVYGPYLDGANYTLAKVLGARSMPDTVKVRHILIATAQRDPQNQNQLVQTRDTVSAKKTIDSIQALIRSGKSFDSLLVLSDDPGSKDKGGVYDSVAAGTMVPEFNDFIFENPVGSKGVVKTEFGYHYIEILGQKGNTPSYKIAYLPKPIIASKETHDSVINKANIFAGDSRDIKSFDDNFKKSLQPLGLNKGVAIDIKPADSRIQGLPSARSFVKKIYESKLGEVITPEPVGDNYVVAVVTEINKTGTQTASKARLAVEPLLRNKKKAEMLTKKVGKVTTLEAAATALGKTMETVDSIRLTSRPRNLPVYEPKVNGATFNPDNKGKVVPEVLSGQNGIYVIRVENVNATAVANANVAEQRKQLYQQGKQTAMYSSPVNALKNAASIKDNRASRF